MRTQPGKRASWFFLLNNSDNEKISEFQLIKEFEYNVKQDVIKQKRQIDIAYVSSLLEFEQ